MKAANLVLAIALGVALGFVTLFSIMALVPYSENYSGFGPAVVLLLVNAAFLWLPLLLRLTSRVLPDATQYIILAAALATFFAIFMTVKGENDPPAAALSAIVFWLPVAAIYRLTPARDKTQDPQ
jgi:hypothetical protein